MEEVKFILTPRPVVSNSLNEVDWDNCLCHRPGVSGELNSFTDQLWKTFRNAADIRQDSIYNNMKDHWGEGPRGWYHRKCYQIYTMKRNLNLRKRKVETEKRDSWTPKPAKLPRTFDKSKCIVCLNDKHQDSKRLNLEKLSQCLTEEAIENMKLAGTHQNDTCLVKRLDRSDSTVLYHRSCYKKLTKCLYRTDDKDNTLSVHWIDKPPVSEALLLLISCGCKSGCTNRRCTCFQQGLSSTDGCKCNSVCQNISVKDSLVDTDDSDDGQE